MKLLRFKIGSLPDNTQFRSLYSGFEVTFRDLGLESPQALDEFNPFCFAGLNGRGKSNVLEALATVFFHLECCVAKFLPRSYVAFSREVCPVDAFTVEYLIQRYNGSRSVDNFDRVRVEKKSGQIPCMYVSPYHESGPGTPISLEPVTDQEGNVVAAAPGKIYLPDRIIGYSSGENEILSLPFRKSRLINYDKYKEDFSHDRAFELPENSLIYVDAGMSQAVLLACLLFEDSKTTLDAFKNPLKIKDILSFRININLHKLQDENREPITGHVQPYIEILKKCATCYYEEKPQERNHYVGSLALDFYVNPATRTLFRKYFRTSFDFFRFFQVLYELNYHFIPESLKQDIYASKGIYHQEKLPEGTPDQHIFYFQNFYILKELGSKLPPAPLLLKEFSDGEHQFIHTMGICLMLQDQRSLLLLDEPETHFNPEWRSKFIQMLSRSLQACHNNNLLQDVIITSHSPFIVSDCKSDNVILFRPDPKGRPTAQKASTLNITTYGMSVNLLTTRIFEEKHTIGDYAMSKIAHYQYRLRNGEKRETILTEMNAEMGDSVEKLLLINEFWNKE